MKIIANLDYADNKFLPLCNIYRNENLFLPKNPKFEPDQIEGGLS